jgi:lipid A ethanolaminephosphotransferase
MPKLAKLLNLDLSPTLGVEKPVWLTAWVFTVGLAVFESVVIKSGPFQFINDLIRAGDHLYLTIGVVYVICALYISSVFFIVALASRWPYNLIYILIYALVVFADYGYSKALGRFTNFYDIVSAFSATRQQTLDSIYAYVNVAALIPLVIFAGLCAFVKKPGKQFGFARLAFVCVSLAVFYIHFFYVNQLLFDRVFVSSSFGSFWQTTIDYAMLNPFGRMFAPKRERVGFQAPADQRPGNNIIFVFDESIRGDHLSLNGYTRPTTPYLEELARENVLLNWGIAVSASTISHPSYNAMITGATPDMLDSLNYTEINTLPTLFQYAKAMNYRTHLVDGQMKEYWGGNADDLNYVDDYISMKEIGGPDRMEDWEKGDKITNDDNRINTLKQWEIDGKIAQMVNRIFTSSAGNFVFIYKRGAHFPYEKNYPESDAAWTPIYHFTDQYEIPPADQYQSIVNSYDNVLHYNIDDFFRRLSPDYTDLPNNTVIVYTGDHGESFFVDGKAGHGGTTREEAMVPLFMLGLKDQNVDTGFKATHANMFTTLLDLMKFPTGERRRPYAISLFEGKSGPATHRYYNPPAGKKLPFD